jgi:hypothetical protein
MWLIKRGDEKCCGSEVEKKHFSSFKFRIRSDGRLFLSVLPSFSLSPCG